MTNAGSHGLQGKAGHFLDELLDETMSIARYEDERQPGLRVHFAHKRRPLISMLAALDWHREYLATQKFDSVHFANEWDGVVACVRPGTDREYFAEMVHMAYLVQLSLKLYPDVLAWARLKFSDLDWDMVSPMSPAGG